MGLVITQTRAKIDVSTSPGRLEIQTNNADLKLHQKHAKINIQTDLPKVKIDQYEAFASAGLKNFLDLTLEERDLAKQHVLEQIATMAQDGDRMASIELPGNAIAEIAEKNAYTTNEFGLDYLPKVRPKITVSGGTLSIDPQRNGEGPHNGVEADYSPGKVSFNYTRSNVNIRMQQYNSLKFDYRPGKIDLYL